MHKLFARQLAEATTATGHVDLAILGELVSGAYTKMDRERRRAGRSMALMDEERGRNLRDREHTAEQLRDQKFQLDAALNNMSHGLCMFDADGNTVLYNERYLQITGYSAEFVSTHRSLLDRLKYHKEHGDFVDDPQKLFGAVLKDVDGGRTTIRTVRWLNKRILRVIDRPIPEGGWIATFEDITEQHQQEESFRLLFDNNALPMMVFDVETLRFLAVNDAALAQYGYTREQFFALDAFDIRPPRYRADFAGKLDTLSDYQFGHEWHHQKADGSEFIARVYGRQLTYKGRPARLAAVVDVTKRVQAEEERDRSRKFLNSVIENVSMSILVKDAGSLRYMLVNKAAEELFGVPRENMVGKTAREIFEPQTADIVDANDRKFMESHSNFFVPIHKLDTPNGARFVTSNRIAIRNQNGDAQYTLTVLDDVTVRKQVEDQLRQAQKMEAVGNLTGGVAHDFNNLLTIMMGNLDLLREELAGNLAAEQAIEVMLQASERGADLTRHMLAFSRQQPLQASEINVNTLIAATTRLLDHALGENISVEVQAGTDLPTALVDASQLETALLNIAINARDAMPDGGALTISTRAAELDADYAAHHPEVVPGGYVAIEMTDTGTGIAPDVVERVFEPFFTTKAPGHGTGLGLSMVYGFIKQSGGHVKVYSEVGQGTTFRLFLPVAPATIQTRAAQPVPARLFKPAGEELILAVEDNPEIRATVVRQLRDLGYQVREADSARAALEILDGAEPVDLLFTDMILLGGLNGKELALKARTKRANLKVLFTSGFPGTSDGPGARLEAGDVLLSKPYHKRDLARAIAAILSAP